MSRQLAAIQAQRLALLLQRIEAGQPATPVPAAQLHMDLVVRFGEVMWHWGWAHGAQEVQELTSRRPRFAEPPAPKGPLPNQAIVWAQARAGLQGKWEESLNAKVQEVVTAALAEGQSQKQLMKQLAQVFPTFSKARLENIARTELASAYNAGKMAQFRSSSVVKAVQFHAILDDRTTHICKSRDGRIMELTDPRLNENTPPLHYQCRSTIVPLDKWDLEDLRNEEEDAVENFFGWLPEGGPKNFREATDWRHLPDPLEGFGGFSYPSSPAPRARQDGLIDSDRVKAIKSELSGPDVVEFEVGRPPVWVDVSSKVGFTPGPKPEQIKGAGGAELNLAHWKRVHPNDTVFENPDKMLSTGKKQSVGVILVDETGLWLVEPTGHFGGYVNTFPKGGAQATLSHQQGALKELWEETGMQGELLGFLGEYSKTTSQTKLYLAKYVSGQPWDAGWESQKVKKVPFDQVVALLNQSTSSGKAADIQAFGDLQQILDAVKGSPNLVEAVKAYFDEEAKNWKPKPQPVAPQAPPLAITPVSAQPVASEKAIEPLNWENAWDKLDQADFGSMTGQKGSNPGGFARYKDGSEWYLKQPRTSDHARNEHLAAQLYRLAGAEVPEIRLLELSNGNLGVASRVIANTRSDADGLQTAKGVREHFAADAWLGNWDVVGQSYDNLKLVGDRAVRLDPGGALLYRAQGDAKGPAWNDSATEWHSMRTLLGSTSSKVFSGATSQELIDGAKRVVAITDDQIQKAVKLSGFDSKTAKALIKTLIARRDSIGRYAGEYESREGRGQWKNPMDFVKSVKGSDSKTGTDQAQRERSVEMTTLVGPEPVKKYSEYWLEWQSNSNLPKSRILRQEWELLQKQQPPQDPQVRAAIAANQTILRSTFAPGTKMRLYRGFNWDEATEELVAAVALGKTKARVPGWQITSWSAARSSAFSGLVAEQEFELERIVGGIGVTPGFNFQGKFADENEYIVGADDLEGPRSYYHVDISKTTSPHWGPGRRWKTPQEYVDWLRKTNPGELDRIVKQFGANQTLRRIQRQLERFEGLSQSTTWTSSGLMTAADIQSEIVAMQTVYAARLQQIKAWQAAGEVATIGFGVDLEALGQGPWGLR